MTSRPSARCSIAPSPLVDEQRRLVVLGMVQRVNQKAPVAFEQLRGAVHEILRAG